MHPKNIIDNTDTSLDRMILESARRGVRDAVHGNWKPPAKDEGPAIGVFVTVNEETQLRGCIGFPEADNGIFYQTYLAAKYAATEDPRFPPLDEDELRKIDVEVTLLGPPKQIDPLEWKDFKRGLHGLMIRRGFYSGLLLPQVAEEHNFGWEEFLEETCIKAGLLPKSYLEWDTKVYVFSGRVIRDH